VSSRKGACGIAGKEGILIGVTSSETRYCAISAAIQDEAQSFESELERFKGARGNVSQQDSSDVLSEDPTRHYRATRSSRDVLSMLS
jgi:hypothetical protein